MGTRTSRRVLAGAGLALCSLLLIGSVKAVVPPYAPEAPAYRTRGPADAPVTLAEFTDFQCPGCRTAVAEVKAVEQMFPGKVRLVFKHRPFKAHSWAREAARVAECAGKAGRFWPTHDLLYARQEDWAELRDAAEARKLLVAAAREAGCDETALSVCMDDPASAAAVESDIAEADGRRINATPTFFVNGKRFVGQLQLKTHGVNRIEDLLRKGGRSR